MNVILYNAKIYPQYIVRPKPTLVVVTGNRIAAIGTDLLAMRKQFPKHDLINLKGRAVLPGLVDSHTHFYFWAVTLHTVHLEGAATFDDALDRIRLFAQNHPTDEWIIGDGWSADRWQTYHLPTAAELDAVTFGRPAALFSKDQHIVWTNSRALQLAGMSKSSPEPAGGRIDRDPVTNEPTGILREIPGYFPVIKLISRPDPQRVLGVWQEATRIAHSRGVTGFHSMDGPEAWDFFTLMNGRNKLGFRVTYYYPVKMLETLISNGIKSGHGDETLRVGGIKIFADGSLGAQTALMKKPYLRRKNHFGVETTTLAELTEQVGRASRNGLACAIHAIGDQAVANVITAFENTAPHADLRHRIEHLQIIAPTDIPRLKKMRLIASMQPSHCVSDRQLVADYWGSRGKNAYIFKTLHNEHIPLAFGSDCPIEPLDPIGGIHAAINRNGFGENGEKFYPQEKLSVVQAVRYFTVGAAYAAGLEEVTGRIAPGFLADMTILDDDIYTCPPSQIYKARVAATIFNGEPVFQTGDNFS